MSCPKCLNKFGFAFGTCSDCGWNDLDNTYHFIQVQDPHTLPSGLAQILIADHDARMCERRKIREWSLELAANKVAN